MTAQSGIFFSGNHLKAISIKEYANLLVFIVQLVRCTAVIWLMRLPRALNLNENPAQFGIFFSANRLSGYATFDTARQEPRPPG